MLLDWRNSFQTGLQRGWDKMASSSLHQFNDSFELLINGSVVEATVDVYETSLTFGGVIYLWPILFIMTLILVAIKTENPTVVGIYAVLGTVALKTLLPTMTDTIFFLIVVFTVLITLFSLFLSPKFE